ncbi:MAG: HPr family phosphocarrier protein [Candidatus Firestonebacteria bacterium]
MSIQIEIIIKNKLGLHLRAAADFVKLASKYKSDIFVEKDGEQINGKSIMGIMALAASEGTKLIIKAQGEEAKEALDKLNELINNKFGEKE